MSKNIVMQELTASGYEELYPKTNTQEIVSSNATINQFLGGGDSLEDALGYLAGLNQHWWLKKSEENVYGVVEKSILNESQYVRSRYFGSSSYSKKSIGPISLEFSDSLTTNGSDLVMVNSTKTTFNFECYYEYHSASEQYAYYCNPYYATSYQRNAVALKNKYIRIPNGVIFKTTDNSGAQYNPTGSGGSYGNISLILKSGSNTSGSYYTYRYSSEVVGTQPTYTYVSSPNPSAYPDNGATQDGAQYWYIGQPFTYLPRLGKVEVGSYVGTGISSWGITFENTPQFVHISSNTAPNNQVGFWINPKQVLNYWVRSNSQSTISSILSEKTLSCSSSTAAMNDTNTTYQYFAITQ